MLNDSVAQDYIRQQMWKDGEAETGFSIPETSSLIEYNDACEGVVVESLGAGGNRVLLSPDRSCVHPLKVRFHPGASNNLVVLAASANIYGQLHVHGSGSLVVFAGEVQQWSMVNARLWSNSQVFFWGKGSTSNGCEVVMQGDGGRVLVGDDCMFANDIFIRNSDMHPLVDLSSGEWINRPGDVVVESHVWVGQDALIAKRVRVGRGSVVGAKSLVNRSVPNYSLVAGVPGRVVRSNVSWDRPETPREDVISSLASECFRVI